MVNLRRVLFVCESNLHRSPTAERLYSITPGIKSRSAGLSSSAHVQVTGESLAWADTVILMEKRLRIALQLRFSTELSAKELICLKIPDDFRFGEAELVTFTDRLTSIIGPPVLKPELFDVVSPHASPI